MTQYAVRVELYNADYDDYDDLHKKMSGILMNRYVTYGDGSKRDLPNGTYVGNSHLTTEQLRDEVRRISKPLSLTKDASVIVFAISDWAAFLYQSK
ncbi:DUF2622 domain-containing protein [Providencia stuartii]|uniref:DUF2622 domain-containing protein n=1 Tax=Providencia TaxID=586 RepID=UPI001B390A0C|nr:MULTISPECIES: DUF2622 domain-containing protein [Providencia]EJD6508513.1 DUF2622 domain-containing protein [Providencia rettgeri]EKH6498479.1 DUF2622 domain-containing protein [Providencia rettgeri]ELR5030169.1 DUF2622 domain-containing protein [Providencia rettgeri]ELR5051882.1 DUF2622 domain-containing protein [Providencia rettgeri]ELR5157370.1 DUF2622 domain-containing protein [Providencia rettgeri]